MPIFGVLPRIWRDPLSFFQEVARDQGPVARIGLGRFTLFLLSSPDAIEHVMRDGSGNYWKGDGTAMVKPVMGDGLAVAEGDLWRRQRRLMQPAFHKRAILEFAPLMQASIDAMLDGWEERVGGKAFDVSVCTSNLAQGLIWRTLFGEAIEQHSDQQATELGQALVEVNRYMNSIVWSLLPIPEWLPTPRKRRFRRAMNLLETTVLGLIERRRQALADDPEGFEHADLLTRLLAARDQESGKGMSAAQLRDEIMTLFVAGHDTTAGAMSWTLALLSKNPEARERLHAEVDGLATDATLAESNLPYTQQVIDESMRLYPPSWLVVRTPREPDTICGYSVPKGAPLLISQYVMHRHPDLWEDPERFDPDRFAPKRAAARPHYAYFPYGGGGRKCIGIAFAQIAIRLTIASVCRRYELNLAPGHSLVPQPLITLRAKHGVSMTLKRRS
jgi:cytochrome P450